MLDGSLGFLYSQGFHDHQAPYCFPLPHHDPAGPKATDSCIHQHILWNGWDNFCLVLLQMLSWVFGFVIYWHFLFLCGDLESFKTEATFVTVSLESCSLVSERTKLFEKKSEMCICTNNYLEMTGGKLHFFRDPYYKFPWPKFYKNSCNLKKSLERHYLNFYWLHKYNMISSKIIQSVTSTELCDIVTYLETILHTSDHIFFTVKGNYRKVSE